MTEQKATNIHWHDGEVTREKRATLLGHRGATLWFTGLSAQERAQWLWRWRAFFMIWVCFATA